MTWSLTERNGWGSIRINDRDVQWKIFKLSGLTEREIEEKFGFFLRALDFGALPTAVSPSYGQGLFDDSRNIIHPRGYRLSEETGATFCPLTQAPSEVAHDQLEELGLLNLGGTDQYWAWKSSKTS